MAGWNLYGGLLGSDPSMTEEERKRLQRQAMMASGAAMLQGSGWSQTPITTGQTMGAGFMAGQDAYAQGAQGMQQQRADMAAAAQKQKEEAARAELDALIKSGQPIDQQTAIRIAMAAPSTVNVLQQIMKNAAAPKAGELPPLETRVVGGKTYYSDGKSWRLVPPDRPVGGGRAAPNVFRTLTPEEVATSGLAPGTVAQMDSHGQVKIVSKPSGKDEANAEKAEQRKAAAALSANNVLSTIADAKALVGRGSTGVAGAVMGFLPGTDAKDLSAKIDTIKANLGFDRLQQMREQSPTGGALGAIAVQELVALQSTVASLDQQQSAEQLKAALEKIERHYQRWLQTVNGAAPENQASPEDDEALVNKYL
jgi:hypothetical protein